MGSTKNLCVPCSRLFAKSVPYRLHIKNKHGSLEPEQNINPTMPTMVNNAADAMMKNLPASLNIKLIQPQPKPKLEKNWMCAQCKKCFKGQKYLRKHMQDVHKLEPLSLTKSDYLELPMVESTHNRCLPCNKTFPNSLRYRIHIKDVHEKKEPTENYDAENCAQPEDFICIICVKKFAARKSLRNHIYKTYLGLNPEDEKSQDSNVEDNKSNKSNAEDKELDPLADPLDANDSKADPEDSTSKEVLPAKSVNNEEPEAKAEIEFKEIQKIQTVDINSITNGGEDGVSENKDGDTDKVIVNENKKEEIEVTNADEKQSKDSEKTNGIETMDKKPVDDNAVEQLKTVSDDSKHDESMDVDAVKPRPEQPIEDKAESKDVETNNKTTDSKEDEDIVIIEEPKANLTPKNVSEKDKKLIEKMLHMLKKYGCAFCSNRFDTKYALSFHERSHLKEKKSPKKEVQKTPKKAKVTVEGYDNTPKVRKSTKMGSVQVHENATGPVCFKCNAVCKDNSNYKNHILSHYYREFDPQIPQVKPFECPICSKPSRDKITLIRHYAFTHQKIFELTDITPEQLIPPGCTPKTPRVKSSKLANQSTSESTPKFAPSSPSGTDSPMITETSSLNEEATDVQSNGGEKTDLEGQDDNKEESISDDTKDDDEKEKDECTVDNKEEDKVEGEEDHNEEDVTPMETDENMDQSDIVSENLKDTESVDVKDNLDTEKMESLQNDPSDNKENEEELV